ncbi:MAG: GNAT family N-acetyltransferase [Pseudomonadota bacterium]
MTGVVTIRPVAESDRAQWQRLFAAYIAFYEAQIADDVFGVTFARLLSDEPHTHSGFVAERDDGTLVGLAHVLFHRSTWSATGYLYLEDVFVDPDVRGGGVGRALIEAVYAHADALGATRTYWATQSFNETARRLYDRLATLSPFVQYRR